MDDGVTTYPHSVLRDVIALLVVAVACPIALFGGSMVGCVGQGFSSSCALTAIFIAPPLLLVAGVVAGLASRGWTGMLIVFVGTVIGMVSILALSFLVGRPVPVDPVSGVIATVWFFGPVVIGYGIGRVAWHLFAGREKGDRPGA